jgi:hypothetical protein
VAVLAAILLVLLGVFHLLMGVAGVVGDEALAPAEGFAFDLRTDAWGWIHLVVAAVLMAAGIGLLIAAPWARSVAVLGAVMSAIVCFAFIPIHAAWSIVPIALDVLVLCVLVLGGSRPAREG